MSIRIKKPKTVRKKNELKKRRAKQRSDGKGAEQKSDSSKGKDPDVSQFTASRGKLFFDRIYHRI